jgi:hypothetical protein
MFMCALRHCLARFATVIATVAMASPAKFPTQLAVPLAIFCSIYLGGCAQVTVFSDQAPPQSEWKFGVLAIDLAASEKNTIVSTSGFGLISSPSGTALGYSNARVVRIGDDCRVVISANDLEAISKNEELLRLLKSTHNACAA